MKVNEILNEGIFDFGNDIQEMLDKKVSEIAGAHTGIFDHKTGQGWWRRFDGTRYKQPNAIHVYNDDWKYVTKKYPTVKKQWPTQETAMDWAWNKLKSLPGTKELPPMSGEFGSDSPKESILYKGYILVKRSRHEITIQSKSVLRNTDVWKQIK